MGVVREPAAPVEFFARGIDIEVAWAGWRDASLQRNSFAAPHIAGLSALVLWKHLRLTPFQLKSILYLTASNTLGRCRMTRRATAPRGRQPGCSPPREGHRALLQYDRRRRPGDLRREGLLGLPAGRGRGGRARVRSRSRARARASSSGCGSRRATGIAGWVLVTRQRPLVIDDLPADPRFAQDRRRRNPPGDVPTG